MKNFTLKALAIFISLSLYLFVHSQNNSSMIALVVPVELRNLPANKVVLLPALRQAQVSIKGPSFMLREVAISAPTFRLDLPPDIGERFDLNLTGEDLALPPAVEVVSIVPSRMELIFDSIVTKEVPLEVPKIGTLPNDYELVEMQINPSNVQVSGPETELRGLTSLQTKPLDLRAITEDAEILIGVKAPGSLTRLAKDEVKVNVKLKQIQEKKKFTKLKIELRADDTKKYQIIPEEVNIQVVGSRSKIAETTIESILPYVSVTSGTAPQSELPIEISLPEGLSVGNINPAKVKLVHKRVG